MLRSNPHLIEINLRHWLPQLRVKYSMPEMTLSSIPDEEWTELRRLGFDVVWFVGIWTPGAESALIARKDQRLLQNLKQLSPELGENDVASSPFVVSNYRLNPEFGFEWELKGLREKLNSMGMKLMLDFVSNHVAKDAAAVTEHTDYFVQGNEQDYKDHPDWFFPLKKNDKTYYIAYGRDPNFPAWTDSAQINYFNPEARKCLMKALMNVADMADGVRCDMVMLTLNEIHEKVWGWALHRDGTYPCLQEEFWPRAIREVKEKYPGFIFLAEVYWGLEWRVQELGFDYTYDKGTYDRLRYQGPQEVHGHLLAEKLYQKRSARFIDNHDETPSITLFGKEKSMAAGVVISTIKGLRFYSQDQLDGIPFHIPLQFKSYFKRPENKEVKDFYRRLLQITDHPAFHGGEWILLDVRPSSQSDKSSFNILSWSWTQRRARKIVVVNYSPSKSSGIINASVKPSGAETAIDEELSGKKFIFKTEELDGGIHLKDLPPYGAYIFSIDL